MMLGRTATLAICIAVTVSIGSALPASSEIPDAATESPRRVLLLHSLGPHFPPWYTITRRFRHELRDQSPYPIDLYEASLQSHRFGPLGEQGAFIEYLRTLFAERGLDLVIAIGAPAARFFLQHRSQIFPSTPMIITGANEKTFSDSVLGQNDTAVANSFDQGKHIEAILQVLPHTTHIAVVMGDSPMEDFWAENLQDSFRPFADRVAFRWLNKLSADDMIRAVRELPAHSAIYYGTVRVDAHGVPQEEDRMFWRIRELGKAPIFSYIDNHFGEGIVGGPLVSSQEIARRTAAAAVRILKGETAGDIKTSAVGLSAPIFDWRELQRWKISEAALPAGSTVEFREPTTWERYRTQILVIAATLLLQALLIFWLLQEHRRRRIAEAESMQRVNELARMNRFATAGQLAASIAHEIRQPLAAISASVSAGLNWLKRQTPDLAEARIAMERAVEQSHRADDVIKGVGAMFKRETPIREQVNLNELIADVIAITAGSMKGKGIVLDAKLTDDARTHVKADPIQLQQVILNLVMNAMEAMRHAGNGARMQMRTEAKAEGAVLVTVTDAGPSVDPEVAEKMFEPFFTTKPGGMGMGLPICRAIVEAHGGSLTGTPNNPHGMEFQIVLPAAAR